MSVRDRRAPSDWQPHVTRVQHPDVPAPGTYVGPSLRAPDAVGPRRGWLGVLVQFDGEDTPVDVDPADVLVIP